MTDRYMQILWSKAVRAVWGEECANPECSNPAHSCHHVIKRRHTVTRYDAQNGLPLCIVCHPIADRNTAFAMQLLPEGSREYLSDLGMYTLKDWLKHTKQTRDEFMLLCADELKDIIREGRI